MDSWTRAFDQGAKDLHTISETMPQILDQMDHMNQSITLMTQDTNNMNINMADMNQQFSTLNAQIDYMNNNVNTIRKRTTPFGMMRGFSLF